MSGDFQPQGVELGRGCLKVGTVHQLGHAIGFYHEHNRPDRDKYIDIVYDNIYDYYENQFQKIPEGESNTLGMVYDPASIMHYKGDAFSRNGSATIKPKDPSIPFGNAYELSPLDIAKANALYSCGKYSVSLTYIHAHISDHLLL